MRKGGAEKEGEEGRGDNGKGEQEADVVGCRRETREQGGHDGDGAVTSLEN